MAALARFAVVLLLVSVCAELVKAQTCTATDSAALQYFYREIVFSRTEFSTWNPLTNCCGWTGVQCDGNGNVVALDITNPLPISPYPAGPFYLVGTGLLGLKFLVNITIKNVAFNGGIPPAWGTGLTNVQVVDLEGCNIVGPLPNTLCSLKAMITFNVFNNHLSGSLDACYASPFVTFPQLQTWNITNSGVTS